MNLYVRRSEVVLYKIAHPALSVSSLLGATVAGDVVGIALAVLLLVVRIMRPPLLITVTAYVSVFRIGSVLAAVVVGLTVPLAIG